LGLQEIGIEMNRGIVQVDNLFRSSVPYIYAIGDLIEGPMLAHKASDEGYAVAEIIAGNHPHVNYMALPNVIYTYPEVAAIGLTEKEAKEMGLDIVVGICSFKANPRARCSGDTDGFVKVIGAGPSRHLVGMHIIGNHASELIAEGVVAIEKQATLHEIFAASHAHPTLSEAIKEACGKALNCAIHI
jgi:dihydrolipoamide dehydrogenase